MLTRWSDLDRTFSMMNELSRRMNRLFEDYDVGHWPAFPRLPAASWPPVNLYDAGEEFFLRAQVPGLSEKEIHITGNQEVLTISGKRTTEVPEGYSVHRQERDTVEFSRSFTFPCRVDIEKTSAVVKDGVLTVRLAKAAEAKPRQISVKAQ